ncbi:MAG: hypothetical protein AAGF84_11070 [Planctomycetota bacterium]
MPNSSYFPRRDLDLCKWSRSLRKNLQEDPAEYGQTAESIAPFVAAQLAFEAALTRASQPATRTSVAVSEKNAARDRMKRQTRAVVGAIQARVQTTDDQRARLGITIPRRSGAPGGRRHGKPTAAPALSVKRVDGRTVQMRVRASHTVEEGRPRPVGVRGARVYCFVSRTPPEELDHRDANGGGWKYERTFTRQDVSVTLPIGVKPGAFVWFTAAWVSPTDEAGPTCSPVMARVNFDGLSMWEDVAEEARPGAAERQTPAPHLPEAQAA